jgi:hypothetical protein
MPCPHESNRNVNRKMKSPLNQRLFLLCEKFIKSKIKIPHVPIRRTKKNQNETMGLFQ